MITEIITSTTAMGNFSFMAYNYATNLHEIPRNKTASKTMFLKK